MHLIKIVKNHLRKYFPLVFSFYLLGIIFSSCDNVKSNTVKNKTTALENSTEKIVPKLVVTYHHDTIRNDSALKVFKANYSAAQQKIIAATNRIDVNRIRIKSALVIPDTLLTDFTAYSPFPETLSNADSVPKFILINQRIQLFAAYENGKRVQFGPVSSGRKAKPTPNGLFYTNFKAKKKRSTVDGDWIMPWYFNISNYGGVGMHQYTLPGYPASHSCIRMYEENAKWIFDWAEQWVLSEDETTVVKHGTPVLVFGAYDFGSPAPWKLLPLQPNAHDLTTEELSEINTAIQTLK